MAFEAKEPGLLVPEFAAVYDFYEVGRGEPGYENDDKNNCTGYSHGRGADR